MSGRGNERGREQAPVHPAITHFFENQVLAAGTVDTRAADVASWNNHPRAQPRLTHKSCTWKLQTIFS